MSDLKRPPDLPEIASWCLAAAALLLVLWLHLLPAMLAMEAAFGLPGVVAAPIYYAYAKRELADRGLV